MSTAKGRKAEEVACRYLQRQGYKVVERNRRLARGELDIIAVKGDLLVFVEVKAHHQRDASLLAMHEEKCARIVSAAQTWLGMQHDYAHLQCRFDLIVVTPRASRVLPHSMIPDSLLPEALLPEALRPHSIEHIRDVIRL